MTEDHLRHTDEEPEATRRRRGCIRPAVWALLIGVGILLLLAIGLWVYTGTTSFEALVARRIEATLEARMDREVVIGGIEIRRGRVSSVILEDVRIENAEGATDPYLAVIPRIVIKGGIESFRQRIVRVGTIEVYGAELFIELFPEGSPLSHNFPEWKRGEPRRFEIGRIEMSEIEVRGGRFVFFDHRRDLQADLRQINADITPNTREGIYSGIMIAESAMLRFRDWEPFTTQIRTGIHFADRHLTLRGTRVRGRGMNLNLAGSILTEAEAQYELSIQGIVSLSRMMGIMNVEQEIDGSVAVDTVLKGAGGDFRLTGDVSSESLTASGYWFQDLNASLVVSSADAVVEIESARYGGGTIAGTWSMSSFEDPMPMSLDLRYQAVSLEALLGAWNVEASGLRGAIDGSLHYEFVRDDILGGNGRGTAVLTPGAVAFGDAPYPMPVSGRVEFSIRNGVLRFSEGSMLRLPETVVTFHGTLSLEELRADIAYRIVTEDLSIVDRLGVNFGRALGSDDFDLMGLGGAGTIIGTIRGPLGEPVVKAAIDATNARYNEIPIGRAQVSLTWTGPGDTLSFDDARFRKDGAVLQLAGTIRFPANAEPVFNLTIDAENWPVQEAVDLVELDIDGTGRATGRLVVRGTPDRGTVRFADLVIRDEDSRLALQGSLDWLPGEGNLVFDLDIGAEAFPVTEIAQFLGLGDLPIEGDLTGTLHLEGPVETLGGAGSVTLRDGSIAGEPVDEAVADLRFERGSLEVRHFEIRAPAGVLIGEASYDFDTKQFSYVLQPTTVDISQIGALAGLAEIIGGSLQITSSGAGTAEEPELVIEATLIDGTILGSPIPEGMSPPLLYVAIRGGQLVIRGSALDTVTIVGEGRVTEGGELSGDVTIAIDDLGRIMQVIDPDSPMPLGGAVTADLDLGGSIGSLEALEIDGTVTRLEIDVAGEEIEALRPIRFALSDGRVVLDAVTLRTRQTDFFVDGTVSLVGDKQMDLTLRGDVDLVLLQFLVRDADARGTLAVRAEIGGSLSSPRVRGTAELRDASVKFAAFPQLISNIYGSFILRGDRIDIDSLRASVGGGSVVAGGFVTLQGLQPGRIRINVQGQDATLRYFEGITLTSDFDLLLSGEVERLQLQGRLNVDRAVYYKDFDLTQVILQRVLERQGFVPRVAATWQDNVSLRIDVTADDTLAVQNNVANLTGSASLEVVGTLGNPIILGRVVINEGGMIDFQDVEYRVLQGTISFQNPFRNDPYFDITAEGTLKSRGQSLGEIEEYELTVNLTGTIDRITPNISSDPPIGDLTLLTLLSGGVGAGGPAGLGGRSFSQAGTALILSQVGEAIGTRILPFADSVRLDTIGGESGFNPTVTFEKQISSDVFVIVIYDTGSTENIEIIQWQATDDWVIQFTRNSEQADTYIINAIDARFRRRYEGRW